MRRFLVLCAAALVSAVAGYAQASKVQSLVIVPSGESFGTIINSPTGLAADEVFTFPLSGGTLLVTPSAGVSNAWLLGGNNLTATPTLNQIGTTSGQDLQLVAGGASNVRLTLSNAAAVVTVNNGGELRLAEASPGTDYSSFKVGIQTGNISYTLPTSLPTANQVLTATTVGGTDVTLGWTSSGSSSTTSAMGADFNIPDGDDVLNDVTGLSVAVAANTTYEVMGRITLDETSGNDDLRLRFVGPAGAVLFIQAFQNNGGTENGYPINTDIVYDADETAVFHGFLIVAGTSGNFNVQAALVSSSGGTDTWDIKSGSFISIKQW